ncbi:cAMP-regulated phosphoprotein 19 isoform X3 [Rattus norvegicus]|uniref:cAMP-regulated phosphoprotein 19 isoform X3 n=1 Tax=Rattus norvegicus TaxID=10116 RepID=UPI002FD81699
MNGSEVRREPQPLRERGSARASQGRRHGDRRSTMSAEVPEAASAEEQKDVVFPPEALGPLVSLQEMEDKVTSPEKAEEAKLKARYPHLGQKPGGSDFLRKRLQKGKIRVKAYLNSFSILGSENDGVYVKAKVF